MMIRRFLRRLIHATEGVTLIEFAFVAPVLMLVLMATFDIGHYVYARSVLQGALQDAGRDSTLESGLENEAAIDDYVRSQVLSVTPNAEFTFLRKNYQDFNDVGAPEDFIDANGNDLYDSDECFTDANGNGVWDSDKSVDGMGGADDVVVYKVDVTYDSLFPFWKMIGGSQTNTISGTTTLRNQPFADQADRPEENICPTP